MVKKLSDNDKRQRKINQLNTAYGKIYDFSKFVYVRSNMPCILICRICGHELVKNISQLMITNYTCCNECKKELIAYYSKRDSLIELITIKASTFFDYNDVDKHTEFLTEICKLIHPFLKRYDVEVYHEMFREKFNDIPELPELDKNIVLQQLFE